MRIPVLYDDQRKQQQAVCFHDRDIPSEICRPGQGKISEHPFKGLSPHVQENEGNPSVSGWNTLGTGLENAWAFSYRYDEDICQAIHRDAEESSGKRKRL